MTEAPDLHALVSDLRVLVGRLRRRMREQVDTGDFSPSQTAVIVRLEKDGPATVTALAEAEGVRQQSMGATVAALQAAGFVAGSADPADGRKTILDLTPEARETIRAGRLAREDWLLRSISTSLDAAEQHQLAIGVALLRRIAEQGEQHGPDNS